VVMKLVDPLQIILVPVPGAPGVAPVVGSPAGQGTPEELPKVVFCCAVAGEGARSRTNANARIGKTKLT